MRCCNISSWQEDKNIWDIWWVPREIWSHADRGVKGDAKETEHGVEKVMLSVYY